MRPPPDELTLITAVRTFDQGGVEAVPDKLDQIWKILSQGEGSFHAPEEMLVRALLKNMNGTSSDAERIRRYPLTWTVLSATFARIPAFSLSKSLADRKFINILQQTLKEISRPEIGQAKSDSRKRKRSEPIAFDLDSQKQPAHCLRTAEALLTALKVLMSRCRSSSEKTSTSAMGSELLKALFFTSAGESITILTPLLGVCLLSVSGQGGTEPYEGQSDWISTLTAVWELHRNDEKDVMEVASHLMAIGANLLARLGDRAAELDKALRTRWDRDLRRFLTRSVILPSRSFFFNRDQLDPMHNAFESVKPSIATAAPVLFDLVLRAPTGIGGDRTTKRGNDTWIQAVFDVVDSSVRQMESGRNAVMSKILDMAVAQHASLSLPSLNRVCSAYALKRDRADWNLLLRLVELNADIFLVPTEGPDVLNQALQATHKLQPGQEEFDYAAQYLCFLAKGSAKTRDMAGFMKLWLTNLTLPSSEAWCQESLPATIEEIFQTSINTHQLSELLEWLSSQNAADQFLPRRRILAAIARSISLEEFVDVVGTRLVSMAAEPVGEKKATKSPEARELLWIVAEKTTSWCSLQQAEEIWGEISSGLHVKKAQPELPSTLAAFKYAARAWLAQYPQGKFVAEAASAACALISKLSGQTPEEAEASHVSPQAYLDWTTATAPRILSFYVKQERKLPESLLASLTAETSDAEDGLRMAEALRELLLGFEGSTANWPLINNPVTQMVAVIRSSKDGLESASAQRAILMLLHVPVELIHREQREDIMKLLMSTASQIKAVPVSCWKLILSLLVQLADRSTVYEDMSFDDLEALARQIPAVSSQSKEAWSQDGLIGKQESLRLLEELATLTFRQLSSSADERGTAYIQRATSVLQEAHDDDSALAYLVLLKAAVAGLQGSTSSPAAKTQQLSTALAAKVAGHVQAAASKWEQDPTKGLRGGNLFGLLIAIDAARVLTPGAVQISSASTLCAIADQLVKDGAKAGWDIKTFLARHCSEKTGLSLDVVLPDSVALGADTQAQGQAQEAQLTSLKLVAVDQHTILDYVHTVVQGMDESTRLAQLEKLVASTRDQSNILGQLVAISQLIPYIADSRPSKTDTADFDLATAHSMLCHALLTAKTPAEAVLASETLHQLLDQRAAAMTQWNVERTLSTVTQLCAAVPARPALAACPKAFTWLAQLVAVVIRRHRKRLDGHFHLLIGALEALLTVLVRHPYDSTGHVRTSTTAAPGATTTTYPHWVAHAKAVARLLTLVCEPSAASVSRGAAGGAAGQHSALDSDKDKAKRYAGQHMYAVLMRYVQLQLEHVVPHAVREALEPGVYAVLDITSSAGLRIMSDAMDPSGRAVMKELYRQHQKFGKWTGV